MTYNIGSGTVWWQISDFLSDANRNVCSISHRLWDVGKSKNAKTDLEIEGQGKLAEKRDLCPSTRNIRIHIGEFFFRILAIQQHRFMQKADTNWEMGVLTIGKICKSHCLKMVLYPCFVEENSEFVNVWSWKWRSWTRTIWLKCNSLTSFVSMNTCAKIVLLVYPWLPLKMKFKDEDDLAKILLSAFFCQH